MDQKRFISFKTDLRQVISNVIKDGNPEFVEAQFKALAEVYPELKDGASLPDLVVRVNTMPMDVEVNVKTEERLSSTAIKEKLLTSMTDTRFVNYDGYQPKLDNEESCLESLKVLETAIEGSKRRIVYFSCLQGAVLKRLQDITGKKMYQILKLTPYSQSQAYFLINMHKLSKDYNKIMYSSLPIRFFKNNLRTIINICESDAAQFQLPV